MSGQAVALPPSLQPWSDEAGGGESLTDLLGRIHNERGHFRNITKDGLEAEIAAEEQDDGRSQTTDDEDDEEEEAKDPKSRPEELQAARREMIAHVASAQNEALMALDFVSLLLSKDQHLPTMSPFLKQNVKPGTLGMDMWQDMQPQQEQEKTDMLLAKGQKMQSLQQSADSLLSAATRLETNVKRETEYWSQVLSISDRGWSVCRMPRERHNLGVRFGFSEAHGEFGNRGLAALRADGEGQIVLDKRFGGDPKAIRVRILEGPDIVGESTMPTTSDDSEITIEGRIRHARDSLYEEELFHEMILESRQLSVYGIRMKGHTIHIPMTDSSDEQSNSSDAREVVIDLVPLDEAPIPTDNSRSDDTLAQAVALSCRLLLSHAHRERLELRSVIPPPMSAKKKEAPVVSTLGPVLSILQHWATRRKFEPYLARITSLLEAASLDFTSKPLSFQIGFMQGTGSIQKLMSSLTGPLRSSSPLTLNATTGEKQALVLVFEIETLLDRPKFGTKFYVTGHSEPLSRFEFDGLEDAMEHFEDSVAGALAHLLSGTLPGWALDEGTATLTKNGDGLNEMKHIRVRVDSGMQGSIEGGDAIISLEMPRKKVEWFQGQADAESLFDVAQRASMY